MFIDKDGLSLTRSASENTDTTQATETSQATTDQSTTDDPGYAPISPDTPYWGPPASSPGYAPISPDTPSWGPPASADSPGYAPISPDTPYWGPPSSVTTPSTPSWRPPSGSVTITPPIVVIPGQNNGSCCTNTGNRTANVRFLHAAVNQPAVTIRLGNRTVINNMQYGNFTPYYLDSGNQRTLVTVINSQNGRTLYRAYLNLADGTAYTVAVVNSGSGVSLFTVTDTACSSRNLGCLRAVNLSPNSGAVDVFLAGYGRVFQNLGQLTASDYRTIQQGTYRASVSESLPCSGNSAVIMADGYVECNNTRIAVMDSATFNVMNGVTYTLYIIGLAYQFPSLQILPVESDLVY